MIPYGRQSLNDDDMQAVLDVLHSDFLTQGPEVERFEAALTAACDARYAVAVNSATSALHLAYLALDVGPGDLVWTCPVTFVATSNGALMCGAEVGFVDADPETGCMSVDDLEQRLRTAKRTGRLPKVVAPVHLTGRPCDMPAIARLADEFGFKVVEDAAHAIGADEADGHVGACKFSDLCVFSFHPVKIVTTAEGGAITTNDADLAARMARLRSHGITRDPALMDGPSEGDWYYQQIELGYNYRMTDMQAALGRSQMTRLSDFIQRRRELAKRYDGLLDGLNLMPPRIDTVDRSAWHLYAVRLTDAAPPRREAFSALRASGIGVQVHYIPVHLQPFYKRMGFKAGQFPGAEDFYARAISIPMYASLTERDQDTVVATLERIVGRA